jgi:chaperonin cofactor prefoldin
MNDEEIKKWNKQILNELEEIDYDDYEIDYIGNLIVDEKYKTIIKIKNYNDNIENKFEWEDIIINGVVVGKKVKN